MNVRAKLLITTEMEKCESHVVRDYIMPNFEASKAEGSKSPLKSDDVRSEYGALSPCFQCQLEATGDRIKLLSARALEAFSHLHSSQPETHIVHSWQTVKHEVVAVCGQEPRPPFGIVRIRITVDHEISNRIQIGP